MTLNPREAAPRKALRLAILAVMLVTVLFGSMGSAWASGSSQERSPASVAQTVDVTDLVTEVNPAVVTVYNLTYLEDMFGEEQTVTQGSGTGFIIDEDGHIVTNWHVVFGGEEFAVALYDGTLIPAEFIGSDPRDDLAVVKIDPSAVPHVVELGDSDTLEPGQGVVAIGSPLGTFTNTVTEGIVSGLGRNDFFGGQRGNCQNYSNLIQHTAPINPGNSGGPLFNLEGQVIGVNTLGLPETEDGTPLQGLFFSVPSNMVREIADQLIADGRIAVPYIGIVNQPVDQGTFAANDLDYPGGVLIIEVGADTPAEAAGVRADDIILAVDDRQITADQGLALILFDYQPGDTATLTVLRDGGEIDIDLTFGNLPDDVLDNCQVQG